MSDKLFEDLLVIDCASFIAGPAAATILADFGARVIKVEPPEGDGYRQLMHLHGLPVSELNYPWRLTNRNKESLALDLKQEEARQALDKLIEKADVFVTNYPLPVRRKLRLDYEDIRAVNPGIIYASLTPYGEEGPESEATGYDATAWWARSGLMDQVRASKDTPPGISAPGMGDHMSANMLYGAIVTALYRRQKTGKGSKVGTSLMANGLWSNGVHTQAGLDGADMTARLDSTKLPAFTRNYRCSDDRWFMLAILNQAQEKAWPQLARCVGHEEWIEDERFATNEARITNRAELAQLVSEAIEQRPWSEWKQRFSDHGLTCGGIAQAADHGECVQAAQAGMLLEYDDGSGQRTIDSPLFVEGAAKQQPRQAPEVGADSAKILHELGYDETGIQRLTG